MRLAACAAALLVALALVAYPLTLTDGVWAWWLALTILVTVVAAILLRSHFLVAASAASIVSLYALTLAATEEVEPFMAVIGLGILWLLELLDLAVATQVPGERDLLKRRAAWTIIVSLAGGTVALMAQAAGELVDAAHPLLFVAAVACAVAALALISSLAFRAAAGEGSDAV
jgi:hypothetical protein